jgi:hypothetical protein
MAMHVEGVAIVGAIAQGEAVALAFVEDELVFVGVGFAVYGEGVEFAGTAGDFFKGHVDVLDVGCCGCC